MPNNRSESEQRHDEREPGSRKDRGYDSHRYPQRDRQMDHDEVAPEGWRGAYRERFTRRNSDNREFDGQYAAFDREYDYGANESSRFPYDQQGYGPAFSERIPDWRIQGLRGLRPFHGVMENEYGAESVRGSRYFGRENFVGRGPKGYRRSDERIREDVCDVLERHPAIDASEIEITVNEGVVVMRGAVENRAQKRLAEDAIENLTGVKDVRNELSINQSLFERAGELAHGDPSASKETAARSKSKSAR